MINLRELRTVKGVTQREIAAHLGIDRTTFGKYETGASEPDFETVIRIADYFSVSVDYLLGREERAAPLPADVLPLPETHKIPLFGDIACGEPLLTSDREEEMIAAPLHVRADFCLRCRGDSMIGARIYDGDLVYVRQQDDVDDGQIAAVLIDDEATLKRVYRDGGQMILQAENPAIKPLIYNEKDAKSIRILGLAVAVLSKVR